MVSSTIYVLFLIPCLFAIGDDIRRYQQESPAAARARAWLNSVNPASKTAAIQRRVEDKSVAGLLVMGFAFLLYSSSAPVSRVPPMIGTALAEPVVFP